MTDQPTSPDESIQPASGHTPGAAAPKPRAITRRERQERWFEIASSILLAIVAVATAWSGYQSARWDGVQSERYTQASAKRVESTRMSTLAGQHTIFDLNMFNQWLNAHASGTTQLASMYERRCRPEFKPAFEAWLAAAMRLR